MHELAAGPLHLIAILALSFAIHGAGAAPSEAARAYEDCLRLALDEPATLATERAVLADQLEAGLARGAWTADEKAAADAFLPTVSGPADVRSRPLQPLCFYRKLSLDRFPSSIPSTAPVLTRLRARLDALDLYYDGLRSAVRLAALAYADEVWLQARTPSDLAPAQKALNEMKYLVLLWDDLAARRMSSGGDQWTSLFRVPYGTLPPRRYPWSIGAWESLELVDYLSVVASPEPLLFPPDPKTDPVAYIRYHNVWRELEDKGNQFVRRPLIQRAAAQVAEQFRQACASTAGEVKAAIVRGAPLAELREPMRRLHLYIDEVPTPPRPYDPNPYIPGFPLRAPLDYRSLLNERPAFPARNSLLSEKVIEQYRRYTIWLSLLEAEAAGDPKSIARAQDWLHKSLRRGTGPELDLMRSHLAHVPAPAGPRAAQNEETGLGDDPVATLLTRLQSLAWPDGQESSLQPLIALWQAVQGSTAPVARVDPRSIAAMWAKLASLPEGSTLLRLRERAAWAALGYPEKHGKKDLATELMAEFDAALGRNAWDKAEHLLTLDYACATLAFKTATGCERTVRAMRAATEHAAKGQIEQARDAYKTVIREDGTPRSGEMAARALKALPKTPKPAPAP